ncbi:hypothetical protein GCM10011378_36770 [Hymenobacter glacieicola]|uniref:Uncharacterized protein n=1 Tax=Hymenobacter glacieicola TaxID=1562124 RepID=A0ABQ1X2X6_9BACT|nr:hypothetical protein GCM10011378_36770 [Hymenobacter glacieicola]
MNTSEKLAHYLGALLVIATALARGFHYLEAKQASPPLVFGFLLIVGAQRQYIKRLERHAAEPKAPTQPLQ